MWKVSLGVPAAWALLVGSPGPDLGCFDQPPNRIGATLSDLDCDDCGGVQVAAEAFVLGDFATIDVVRFWGGYDEEIVLDSDRFTVVFRGDVAGLPSFIIRKMDPVPATTRAPTGNTIGGFSDEYEYTIDLELNLTLGPGTYWVEIYNDTNDCPWDCGGDDDGEAGIADFLALISQWGTVGTCDFDGGGVDIDDFLMLLAAWGPCPLRDGNDWGWEMGDLDPERGLPGFAFSPVRGNVEEWSLVRTADLAISFECTENPFGCPGDGPCLEPNGTPGCEIAECCRLVCAIDPFCCMFDWDVTCAQEAGRFPECSPD